jgi:hypothetical protein
MYLDPSFGGMLLQVLVAIAAGGGVIIFGMRKKIKALFKKNKNNTAMNINRQTPADGKEGIIDMLADDNKDKS